MFCRNWRVSRVQCCVALLLTTTILGLTCIVKSLKFEVCLARGKADICQIREAVPPSGKGWHPPQGTITMSPSVVRFENEPATTTLYTKGSSAKFTDNDGRKSIAPYSNHGQLPQQQRSSGIVGLRTPPGTESKDANWGGHDQQAATVPIASFILLSYQDFLVRVS